MVDSFINETESCLKFEKQTKQLSKIFRLPIQCLGLGSAFFGQSERAAQTALGTPFQLIAHGPMIGPNEAFGMLRARIDQHHGALKIVDQNLIGLLRKLVDKAREKP